MKQNTMLVADLRTLMFLLVSSLIVNSAVANPEIKGSPTDLRQFLHANRQTVIIEGSAFEEVYSDKAVVSLIVTVENEKLTQAITKNDELNKKVLKDLSSNGINSFNIESSKFTSSPQYRWQENKPSLYIVIRRLKIQVSNNLQLLQIASVVDDNEGLSLVDTSFEQGDSQKHINKVKNKALQSVLDQKKFYEKKLDVILTPIGFDEASVNTTASPGARAMELSLGNSQDEENNKDKNKELARSSDDVVLFPATYDEVEYHATISVEFKITPKDGKD